MTRSLLVLGSGPGIASGVATHFASRGFTRIALVSRNAERVESEDAKAVLAANPEAEVKTYPADLAAYEGIEELLGRVEGGLGGVPEVVVYNASHLTKSALGEYGVEDVNEDLKISTVSLYAVSNWLLPRQAALAGSDPTSRPALLVTSGGLYQNPHHAYFSLSASKAAQHNLTQSLNQAYTDKGVHVAAVVVNGVVKPDDAMFSPKKIAETYWKLYEEGPEGGGSVWIGEKSSLH